MIKDLFVATLREQLPSLDIRPGEVEWLLARIPGPHHAVGDVLIYDGDGDHEVTVFLGYTHAHYEDEAGSPDATAETIAVAQTVAALLAEVVQDRILMWGILGGLFGGGYRPLRPGERPVSSWWCQRCLWSRPC